MTSAALFQWVALNKDVPNSAVKAGDRAVVVDQLSSNKNQLEPGYILEVFQDGETVDVVSVPISWVTPLPEMWSSLIVPTTSDPNHTDQNLRQWLEESFGIKPKSLDHYKTALTDKKYEALEFFGNYVLDFVLSEYLLKEHSIDDPKLFDQFRQQIASNKNLAKIGKSLGIGSIVKINIPTTSNKEHSKNDDVADVMEALIGAIHLDLGMDECKKAVYKVFDSQQIDQQATQKIEESFEKLLKEMKPLEKQDYTSALLEFLTRKGEDRPECSEDEIGEQLSLVRVTCKFHNKQFSAEAEDSKNRAIQKAHKELFEKLIKYYRECLGIFKGN